MSEIIHKPKDCIVECGTTFTDSLLSSISELRSVASFTDFTITTHGNDIPCHKVVLAAACPYFHAMLASGMKEVHENQVNLDHLSADIVSSMVDYFYTGKIKIGWDDMKDAIEACEMLQVRDLKRVFEDFVCKNLSAAQCIGWYKFAEKFSLEKIKKSAKRLLCECLDTVSESDEFKQLELVELIDYIKDESVAKDNCDLVLEACTTWLMHDRDVRKDSLKDLLAHIAIGECTEQCLTDVLEKCAPIDAPSEVLILRVLTKVIKSNSLLHTLTVIGGMRKDGQNCQCYSLANCYPSTKWVSSMAIPDAMLYDRCSVCVVDGGFALLGGSSPGSSNRRMKYTNNCFLYLTKSKSWKDLPPLPYSGHDISSIFVDNAIYALGGYNNTQRSVDVVCHLNLKATQWHTDPSLLKKQYNPITAAIASDIYLVFNTGNEQSFPITLHSFNTKASLWTKKSDLPSAIHGTNGASAVTLAKDLYLIGGAEHICAKYSSEGDAWSVLTFPAFDHKWGSAVLTNQTIYVCGGGYTDLVEEYDIEGDTWKVSAFTLPVPLSFLTVGMTSAL